MNTYCNIAIDMRGCLAGARIIDDDTEAKAYLMRDNAHDLLAQEPPFDAASITYRNAEGYIYANRSFTPGDEGYVVLILPEANYTEEQAALILSFLETVSNKEPGTEHGEWLPYPHAEAN